MARIVIIETTLPSKRHAQDLANDLVTQEHVACASISRIESTYLWKEKIVREAEWLLTCKTNAPRAQAAIRAISAVHPYEIPCILQHTAHANPPYVKWVHSRRAKRTTKHIK